MAAAANRFMGVDFRFTACAAIAATVVLAGCTSAVVYKSSAASFVSAGRAVVKSFSDTSAALVQADDQVKLNVIAADANCRVDLSRIFVWPEIPSPSDERFSVFLAADGASAASGDCRALVTAEAQVPKPTGCLSEEANTCVGQLGQLYAAIPASTLAKDGTLADNAEKLRLKIRRMEYHAQAPLDNKVAADGLDVLIRYLDLLDSLADDEKSEVVDKAAKLSTDLPKLTKFYDEATSNTPSATATANRAKVATGITAIAAFYNDVGKQLHDAKDEAKIKDVVLKNKAAVPALIQSLRAQLESDDTHATLERFWANRKSREQILADFKNASPNQRKDLVVVLDKYPLAIEVTKSFAKLFDTLDEANKSLLSLIEDPTSEQKQKLRSAAFDSFKTTAEDTVAVIQLIK